MNSSTSAPISTSSRIFVWLAVVIGTIQMIDFIFYGQEIRNLLSSIGFALLAYGAGKNGLSQTHTSGDRSVAVDVMARYATYIGALLAVLSVLLRFVR